MAIRPAQADRGAPEEVSVTGESFWPPRLLSSQSQAVGAASPVPDPLLVSGGLFGVLGNSSSMPLVYVFDLGNVLVHFDERVFLRKLTAACSEGAPVAETVRQHVEALEIETGGDFEALHPLLVRDVGLMMTPAEFRLAWNDIFESTVPGMPELVAEMPRPRYMLSTTNAPHAAWLRQRFPQVFALFDHCFLSNEVGLKKPDIALFRHVESVTGASPERHVFVDDVARNVAGARAAGWQAFEFAGAEDCRRQFSEVQCRHSG
jgi:putative hydrolase of the HAD superfamily